MSRESRSEQNLALVKKAIRCFLIGMVALTFGRVIVASLNPVLGISKFHRDTVMFLVNLFVLCFIGNAIFRLPNRVIRVAFGVMSGLLLTLQLIYVFGGDASKSVRLFLQVSDAVVIALLVLVVYRLATVYAGAREAIEDEFLGELADGTSTRIGNDFLSSLASSAVRTLRTHNVCITVANGAETFEEITASASRFGSVPPRFAAGQTIDVRCDEIHGQCVQAIPLTDSVEQLVGHLCLLHDGGLTLTKRQKSTLRVFSARASAELERKQLDEANSALESKMMQVQKLESLGLMAGGIAHDFNNLLAAIRSRADVLRYQIDNNASNNENIKGIESAVERGASLCDRLLAYAGCAVLKNRICNINHLIRQLNTVVQSTHPDQVFELRLADDKTDVWGDEAQLSQVLLNLMTNAVEASKRSSGRLLVRTFSETECDAWPHDQSPSVLRPCVLIEVRDHGIGISKQDIERIYDPFYTSKGNGRGLGLAAVLGIVRQHGGEINVSSQSGIGTTFTVALPLHRSQESEAKAQVETTTKSANDLECRVLVVDDDQLVRNATACLLKAHGVTVTTAKSGDEAIEIARREGDVFHAIILDQTMPGMTGIETFAVLREQGATGLGILMSGYSEQALSECPIEMTFLSKPFSTSELVGAISKSLPFNSANGNKVQASATSGE